MSEKDTVVGKALYAEFRNGGQTYQILITPDGVSTSGKNVPAVMYRRQISRLQPRKGWKHFGLSALSQDEFGVFKKYSKDEAQNIAVSRLELVAGTFNQLISYHYKVYKQPIFVEVSKEDLEGIRAGKTPYKVLGRITRVRRALGFGEELFVS